MIDTARRLEAVIFISPRPVPTDELVAACDEPAEAVEAGLAALAAEYAGERHGIELAQVAGGYVLRVARDCEAAVERFAGARRPDDLSPALLETLAVVAYLQPTTRAEVAQVRGVSSEWALTSLVERGLVEERGRADTPGAPILYATSARFLQLFGLRTLTDLDDLDAFALSAAETDELRARLLSNAERRRP
jgi:segregation and condensation protein B